MTRATAPRNSYGGIQNALRPLLEREKQAESRVSDQRWIDLERDLTKFLGRDSGPMLFRILRRGEHDFPFFCERVLGVKALPWQARAWQALNDHENVVVRGPNGLGKTTGIGLINFKIATYRHFAGENWGTVGLRHLGPLQAHANKVLYKMQDIIGENAREQAYRVKGGWKFRPCLISKFISDGQLDGYPALDFFGGSAYAAFSPSGNGATSADGDDPVFVSVDEWRHETNVRYVMDVIIQPRYLRVPDGRLFLPYTPDVDGNPLAAMELGELFRKGQLGRKLWISFAVGLDENRTITKKAKDRVSDGISDERSRAQAMRGEEVQPSGAFFNWSSLRVAFGSGPERVETTYLGDGVCPCSSCDGRVRAHGGPLGVKPLKERIAARCKECRSENTAHAHPFAAFSDPASSAPKADGIAFTVWDLEVPGFDGAEAVYTELLAPGTELDEVAKHADAIATHLGIEVGHDGKGGLGIAMTDELFKLSGTHVPLKTDTEHDKDEWLTFLKVLIGKKALRFSYHARSWSQFGIYVRKDRKIPQDLVMVQAGCAQMAMPDLPDRVFDRDATPTDHRDDEDVRLDGMGEEEGDFDEVYGDVEDDELVSEAE